MFSYVRRHIYKNFFTRFEREKKMKLITRSTFTRFRSRIKTFVKKRVNPKIMKTLTGMFKRLQRCLVLLSIIGSLILKNFAPSSISYYTSLRVQYDILRGTILLNISAITFYNIVPNISDNYISPHFDQFPTVILFMSLLLACKYGFTRNLSSAY